MPHPQQYPCAYDAPGGRPHLSSAALAATASPWGSPFSGVAGIAMPFQAKNVPNAAVLTGGGACNTSHACLTAKMSEGEPLPPHVSAVCDTGKCLPAAHVGGRVITSPQQQLYSHNQAPNTWRFQSAGYKYGATMGSCNVRAITDAGVLQDTAPFNSCAGLGAGQQASGGQQASYGVYGGCGGSSKYGPNYGAVDC